MRRGRNSTSRSRGKIQVDVEINLISVGTGAVMTTLLGGICELVLETEDPRRLERFYARLGLTVLSREGDRVWLAAGSGSRLGLWTHGPKEHRDRGGRHVHFALSVRSGALDRAAATLAAAGVETSGPVAHEGGDRSLYFFDPEGNRVELWDYFEDGEGRQRGVAALAD
jgi:catechol-2,3-dioxygenase